MMAAVQQEYPTQSPITVPRIRIMPPIGERGDRDMADTAERDLLQSLLGQVAIPSRPLTASEREAMALLVAVLAEGRWTGTWSDLSFGVDAELAERLVADFADDTVRGLSLLGPDQLLELFGQGIYLGPERLVFLQARLANPRAVRARLARRPSPEEPIELHFVPAENTLADSVYALRPRLLEAWAANGAATSPAKDTFDERLLGDYLRSRSGLWHIGVSRPLNAPIELPEDPGGQLQGWVLDVPDRVGEGIDQLDRMERSAVLTTLWEVQRHGERGLGEDAQRVENAGTVLYVLHPTPEVRVILERRAPTDARVIEIVRAKTLTMFRER